MYRKVTACRVCGNKELVNVLELGVQALTGLFPKDPNAKITSGPLTLVKCHGANACGLLQLAHSYPLDEMYGDNYGYRSGLNPSMVAHLKSKVAAIEQLRLIERDDVILDIGSNDATTLKQYQVPGMTLVGIDPTARKFREFYSSNITLIPEFFSAASFLQKFKNRKAKVVTSFAMFYDLEDPVAFMQEIAQILHDEGVWVFEQSYMPQMLRTNAYDTVCHEHLEYYSLSNVLWMAKRAGLKIVDVELNDINGGSFSVTAQKLSGTLPTSASVRSTLESERVDDLDNLATYEKFRARVVQSKKSLVDFLRDVRRTGKTVCALGASTKGNVILQYCGIDSSQISSIGEINADKFGAYTPGTHVPIVDETVMIASKPDYVLVLPWHFRNYFENQPRYSGLKLVYPLPTLSLV